MGNFDEYFPFDPGFGASANAARWRKMARLWAPDGVLQGYNNGLSASVISGGATTISTGAVFNHGYYCEISNPQSISITGTGTGTIVAKVDMVNEVASIYYKDGATDYGASPTTNFEQSASNWEIPLWGVVTPTLTDLRTMVSPGQGVGWWVTSPGPIPVAANQTVQTNFLTARVPYTGMALLRGEILVTFNDSSAGQSAACQLTYQFGSGDQQVTPTTTPAIPGGGPSATALAMPVAISGLIPVAQGKKTVGWRVTAGAGTSTLKLTTLTASLTMLSLPATA
jgi:hypothetical protein